MVSRNTAFRFFLPGVTLVVGVALGLSLPWNALRDLASRQIMHSGVSPEGGLKTAPPSDIVELTEVTQSSIGLKTACLVRSDFQSSYDVPAFVRELPGAANLHLDSRFRGIVEEVFVSEGETVRPGQPLYSIELADETLATAQAELLDAMQQIEILDQEIRRLEPGVAGGGVAGKSLLEAQYEKQRLQSRAQTRSQELLLRGLTAADLASIAKERQLIRQVTIALPHRLIPPQLNAGSLFSGIDEQLVVEELLVKPGAIAQPGDPLCSLAYHAVLAIEGQAYEKDLPQIRQLLASGRTIDVTVGPEGHHETIPDQSVAYLTGHVDDATNTYPFFIYLRNEPLFNGGDGGEGGRFVTWRWKPGQRAHIRVPDQRFENQVVVPADAIAVDGLKNLVFRWEGLVDSHDDHDHEEGDDHNHPRIDAFQAVEVRLLHRDRDVAVIDPASELEIGDRIAINHATQLMFALKTSRGGAHGHDHEH
jgi:multidrug efflux pump subunit AcrA (membrane-fusion protein)